MDTKLALPKPPTRQSSGSQNSLESTSTDVEWSEPAWAELTLEEQRKKSWILLLLTAGSKLETLIFALGCGLLTAAMLITIVNPFSPLIVTIIASLCISILSARILWGKWGANASPFGKALIVLSSLFLGFAFALGLAFAAAPAAAALGLAVGETVLFSYANAALYVVIGLGIIQLTSSSIANWKSAHARSSQITLQLAQSLSAWLGFAKPEKALPYSFSEKIYLGFGALASLSAGIVTGALTYHAVVNLLPGMLLTLGVGAGIGSAVFIPIGLLFLVATTLVMTKMIMATFVKRANAQYTDRFAGKRSLLSKLLDEQAHIDFSQQPLHKISLLMQAFRRSLFSHQAYIEYQVEQEKKHLTRPEFKRRALIRGLFFPFTLMVGALKSLRGRQYQQLLEERTHQLSKDPADALFFWKDSLPYLKCITKASWDYLFSYETYKTLRGSSAVLTKNQFYLRNMILFFAIPLGILGVAMTLYSNYLGTTKVLDLFQLSESAALAISASITALAAYGFSAIYKEATMEGPTTMLEASQKTDSKSVSLEKGVFGAAQIQNAAGNASVAAYGAAKNVIFMIFAFLAGFINSFFIMLLGRIDKRDKKMLPASEKEEQPKKKLDPHITKLQQAPSLSSRPSTPDFTAVAARNLQEWPALRRKKAPPSQLNPLKTPSKAPKFS